MSNNVDNRVVRMTFDNTQFEKNIKNTMKTLSEFEQKLKFSTASKGFEAIKSAADKLNFSALGKNADAADKKIANLASNAKSSLDKMQQQLDKADFSSMGSSADKAANQINKALSSIDFDSLDKNAQIALSSITNEAGKVDLSPITDAAGRVDFSALPDNVAIAIATVMDMAGDVNFDGMAKQASNAMADINSAADKVDFSSIGVEANDAISQVNNAAGQADFSPVSNSAWTAATNTNNAISNIDLYSIADATDEASRGFQAMEAIAVGALLNIGNKITDLVTGKLMQLGNSLMSPITEGLGEYQTQIGAIQTILANTGRSFDSSSDIAEVNAVLDELNTYADKTIYNFTEMVKNIGMFTAAGTDMYQSADAIKGMSNLAALQGADPVSAARAMYQTSQALSSGVVKLMDWRSLENAGMAGEIFRNVVLNAAEKKFESLGDEHSLGLVRSIQSGDEKFTDTLTKEEWLTSDILLESLTQLTYAFGDLTDETANLTENERKDLEMKKKEAEEHLKSLGYTQEEIEAVFELGDKAQKSATEVRTFTQLIDSLKEAMGSGWTETWRYILGDFKEITDVMTKLNNALTTVIGTWDNARNTLLGDWADLGGHYELFGGTRQIYQKDAEGNIMEDKNGNPILLDEKEYVGAFDNILEAISKPLTALRDAAAEVFGDYLTGDNLMNITEAFNDFTASLVLSEDATEGLKGIFEAVFEVIKAVSQIATHVVDTALNLVAVVRTITDPIFDIVLAIFGQTGEGFAGVIDWLLSVEDQVYRFINSGLIDLADILDTIVGGFFDLLNIPGTISIVGEAIGSFFTAFTKSVDIGDILNKAGDTIGGFFIGVLDSFGLVPKVEEGTSLPVIFEKIKESANKNLSKAMDKIIDAIPGMRDFVTVMSGDDKEAKVQFFIDLFKKIGDVVLPVVVALAAPLVALKDALVGLFNVVVNSKPVQDLIKWVTELKDKAIDWLLSLPTKITTTATNLGQAFDVLLGNTKITEVSSDVRKMVNEIGDINITTPFVLLGGGIREALKTVITTVRGAVTELSETLFGWIDDDPKEFTRKLKEFIAGLPSTFSNAERGMKEFAKILLPNSMNEDIDNWFRDTHVALTTGLGRLSTWISTTTAGSKTVPDALIAIITGGWTAMINAIKNFDPQEAAINILNKLDELKNSVLTSTGGFLDYIFGFKKERVPGAQGYEEVGFTFTEYFQNIGENMSKGIEEAKNKINSLFKGEDETIFDKITKFFTGDNNSEVSLQIKMDNLSKNLNESARSMTGDFTKTVTDPSLSFDKVSGFIDTHKNDIFTPLQGITTWFDTVLFPNTNRIFTTGLETIRKTITGWFEDIHKFLEPFFKNVKSWPEFFSTSLDNVAKAIGSGLGDIINFFGSDDFSFAKMFDTIGEKVKGFVETVREKFPLIGDILGGVLLVVEPIFATLAGLISGIGDGALSTGDTLAKAFSDIPGTISSIWEGITSTFGGAWDSFLTSLDEKVPGAKGTIEQVLTDLNDMFNIFDGKIGESSGGILGHISEFFNGLIPIAQNEESKGAVDIIKEVLTNLWDSLNEDKLLVISTAIEKVGVGILLVNLGKFIGGLKEVVDKIFLGKEKKSLGDKMKDVSEAIAIVTGCIWVLSQIKEEDLTRAKDSIGEIILTLAKLEGIGLVVSALTTKFQIEQFSSVKDQAAEIFAMTLAIVVIGMVPPEMIDKATGVIIGLKAALSAIDFLTNAAITGVTYLAGLDAFAPITNSVTQILGFAFAVLLLSFIKQEDLDKAIGGLFAISMVMVAFQGISGLLSAVIPPSDDTIKALSSAAVKLAAAVAIMCFGFSFISDADTANLAIAAGAVVIILGIFGLVTAFTQAEDAKKTATAMVIAAASVVELCFAFTLVDGMDNETLEAVGTAVAKIVAIFGLVIAFTQANDAIKTAEALVIASFSVIEMCAGFWMVKDVNNETIETVAIAVDSILIIMGLIVAFTKAQDVIATGGALAIASLSVLEMCVGFWMVKDVKNETIEAVGTAVAKIMAIFGLIVTFTKEIDAIATGVSLALAGAAVIEMCEGFKSLDGMNVDDIQSISDSVSKIMGVMGIISAALSLPIFQGGGLAMIEIAGAFWIFAEALKAFADAIRAILELEADLPGLVENANKGLEQLKGKIKEHFDALIGIAVEWWNTVVMPKVNEFLQGLSDWWENTAKPAISKFFDELPENFKNWWDNTAFPAIQGALDALSKWWHETALPAIGKFLDEAPEKLAKWWNETAWPTICKIWDALGKWWTGTAWPAISKFFTTDLPKKIGDWWENTAKPALKNVKDKAWKAVTDNWEKLKKKVATAISEWWKGLKEGFNEKVEGVKKFVSEIPEKIFKALGDLKQKGADIVTGIINGMVEEVQSNPIVQAVNSVGESISGGLNKYFGINSPSKLMRDTVGKAIPEGIGVGITKYSSLLRKPVLKMGGETLKSITRYFGIHSPSRLMRDKVGKYIPAGIAAGMDEYAVIAVDSAEELGSSVSQAVYSGLGDISASKYGYGISPVIDIETLKTDIEVLHEMLRIKIDEAMQGLKDYLTEQINLNYQIDEERYANLSTYAQNELARIYEYVETEKTNLYGYFDQLTASLTEEIPNMTQQILGAFDTTNQTVAGILQTISSEQRQAVDSAITGTIVESLSTINSSLTNEIKECLVSIAAALNGDASEDQLSEDYKTWYYTGSEDEGTYEEHYKTKKSSLVGILLDFYTKFQEWKIHDVTQNRSDVQALLGMIDGKGVGGNGYYSESIQDSLVNGGLYHEEQGLAETVIKLLSAIVGGDLAVADGNNLMDKMNTSEEKQEELSQYLYDTLGGSTGKSSGGNAIDSLSSVQDGQLDLNKLFSEAVDKFKSIDGNLDDVKKTQTTLSDVIDKINSNTKDMSNMDVYLDSGELVGALAPTIDASLGWAAEVFDRTGLQGVGAAVRDFGSKI